MKDAHGNTIKVGDEVRFFAINSWEVGTIVKLRKDDTEYGGPPLQIVEIVMDNDPTLWDLPWKRCTGSIEKL